MIIDIALGSDGPMPLRAMESFFQPMKSGTRVLLSRDCSVWSDVQSDVTVIIDGYISDQPNMVEGIPYPEILGRLYLQYGDRALRLVDGAFLAIITDERRSRVVIANDRLGKKSGFVIQQRERLVVSCSIQELSSLEGISLSPDKRAFFDILSLGCVPAPRSMFEGVSKLTPGALWSVGREIECSHYYDLSEVNAGSVPPKDLGEEVRFRIVDSVRRGAAVSPSWSAFLSGGMDSSSVVWGMSKHIPSFSTYYANFGQLDNYMAIPDEIGVARDVARSVGSEHSELLIEADGLARVPGIVSAIGEPICDGGPIVVDRVLASAAHRSRGIMTGNGGDFLFGGERRHLLHMLIANRSVGPLWSLARIAAPLLPVFGSERLARLRFDLLRSVELQSLNIAEFYAHRFNTPVETGRLLGMECPNGEGGLAHVERSLKTASHWDGLSQLLYLDLKLLSPNLILRDVNLLAEQYGMTAYHPFFDARFVEYALTLPSNVKIRGLTLKYALRSAMRGHLPASVLNKKKGGLGAPILYWLTSGQDMVEDCLSPSVVSNRGLFDPQEIARMKADTQTRRRDYSMLLWTAFTCELWMREFIDGRQPVPSTRTGATQDGQLGGALNARRRPEFRSAL